ncbi:hypothetical protein GXW82_14015 [Streptacidiphilus sp. 4-A2]|nr:hypothetical protein [Streptacidiphilus sp. 4-A2]
MAAAGPRPRRRAGRAGGGPALLAAAAGGTAGADRAADRPSARRPAGPRRRPGAPTDRRGTPPGAGVHGTPARSDRVHGRPRGPGRAPRPARRGRGPRRGHGGVRPGHPGLQDLVGFFANTVALRTDLSGAPTFAELLTRVREADLDDLGHARLPFDRVVELTGSGGTSEYNPLFQVSFGLAGELPVHEAGPGLTMAAAPLALGTVKFDLSFDLTEQHSASGGPAGVVLALEYAAELFDPAPPRPWPSAICSCCRRSAPTRSGRSTPARCCSRASASGCSAPAPARPPPPPARCPSCSGPRWRGPRTHPVRCGQRVLSYAELDARADALARELTRAGVGPESRVALLQRHSAGRGQHAGGTEGRRLLSAAGLPRPAAPAARGTAGGPGDRPDPTGIRGSRGPAGATGSRSPLPGPDLDTLSRSPTRRHRRCPERQSASPRTGWPM